MILLEQKGGLLHEHDDGKFRTKVYGFVPGTKLNLLPNATHFGVVASGSVTVYHGFPSRTRPLSAEDFFSVPNEATVYSSTGAGIVISAMGYNGLPFFGGPIEEVGRLRYIDGCTDTLLVPPVLLGDPCLNLLHFPPGIKQSSHDHPSVRAGVVLRGGGVCVVPGKNPIPLTTGSIFLIPTGQEHKFDTEETAMDVIAFHPDTDFGPTHDDHPMVNRTIVDGIPANLINEIRTRE